MELAKLLLDGQLQLGLSSGRYSNSDSPYWFRMLSFLFIFLFLWGVGAVAHQIVSSPGAGPWQRGPLWNWCTGEPTPTARPWTGGKRRVGRLGPHLPVCSSNPGAVEGPGQPPRCWVIRGGSGDGRSEHFGKGGRAEAWLPGKTLDTGPGTVRPGLTLPSTLVSAFVSKSVFRPVQSVSECHFPSVDE